MDAESWNARLSSASKHYQSTFQSRSDMILGFEEIDGDEDTREEFSCPFCLQYFDVVGLCCHIDDEHPLEAKDGVCPICTTRVGIDMVAHITLQHGNIIKLQRKRKLRKGGSHSTLSLLKKELRDGNLQYLLGGPGIHSSSSTAPDPLLSSFILPMEDDHVSAKPHFSPEIISDNKCSDNNAPESHIASPSLSTKDKEEKARRCEFVRGLLLSTILED